MYEFKVPWGTGEEEGSSRNGGDGEISPPTCQRGKYVIKVPGRAEEVGIKYQEEAENTSDEMGGEGGKTKRKERRKGKEKLEFKEK